MQKQEEKQEQQEQQEQTQTVHIKKDRLLQFGFVLILIVVCGSIIALSNLFSGQQTAADNGDFAPTKALVHIKGQVQNPGVYEVNFGARVAQAIEQAGGLTDNAYTDGLNMALQIEDGQEIYVPKRSEYAAWERNPDKVNINTATEEEIGTLDGVGPTMAQRIVAHRKQYGPFVVPQDVKRVSGIGDSLYEKIKDKIVTE